MRQLNSNKPALILTHSLSDKAVKVVKGCNNVIGICNQDNGTLVINKDGESFFPDINLWDIREMIKEVF